MIVQKLFQRISLAILTLFAFNLLLATTHAQLLSIKEAVKASTTTGRPILAVAGGET